MFGTLDKLHSHSKWIYINKEADTAEVEGEETAKEMGATKIGGGGAACEHKEGRTSTVDQGGKSRRRQSEREGCKLVNERGFSRVLGLYKVGSEGLTEVL